MFGADVLVAETLGFFRGESQDAFALLAERHFHGGGNTFADGDPRFDFLANRFDRAVRPQEPVRQSLILAQQAEQQVLRLDERTAVLARLVASEKYYASSLLCVAFKHGSPKVSEICAATVAEYSVEAFAIPAGTFAAGPSLP